MIGNTRPTEIDRNLGDVLFHRPRPLACLRCRYQRRSHDHRLTLNEGPRCFDIDVNTGVAFQAKALHRLAALRAHFVIIRSLIHDRRVVVSNVGDVGRLINNSQVALWRHDRGLDSLRTEFSGRNEGILVRTDVVIVIRPIVDAGALIESRFRGQRRPADVIVALPPRNPSRCPLLARNPNPADAAQTRPTSVVISGPPEWLFGNPSPAGVGVNPATVRVRTPTPRTFRFARLPDIAVIRGF